MKQVLRKHGNLAAIPRIASMHVRRSTPAAICPSTQLEQRITRPIDRCAKRSARDGGVAILGMAARIAVLSEHCFILERNDADCGH